MTILFEAGGADAVITDDELQNMLQAFLKKIGDRKKVMIIPPDFTRFHSKAGVLTQAAYKHYQQAVTDVMPALGTHAPVTDEQRVKMFGEIPEGLFRVHDWRNDVVKIGEVPAKLVETASDGTLHEPWPAQVNKLLWTGGHDLVLSIGQVVPHEVLGMANYNKNIFVGVGGAEAINFSHFIGAVYGMERMMGRADNPLRRILNYASKHFLSHIPLVYVLTVVGLTPEGKLATRGLFIGDDDDVFYKAAKLSLEVNFTLLKQPIAKAVVYMNPDEYHSTWLGNKSIYRTRMALADKGELIVLAPGVKQFGEDKRIDELIRKFGYRTTPEIMKHLESSRDLMRNLSAAAHLIHGTSEKRFSITYCPGHLTQKEIESVGYEYGDLAEMTKRYDPKKLKEGYNTMPDGEKVFYISNPAVGLWAYEQRFKGPASVDGGAASGAAAAASAGETLTGKKRQSADEDVGGDKKR